MAASSAATLRLRGTVSQVRSGGVFTAQPIARGTLIWKLNPDFDRLIPVDQYEAAPPFLKDFLDRYAYPSPDRPGFIVYEVDNGRFMNHSKTPNTDFSQPSGGFALRDIAAGEELTCDYGGFFADFELIPNPAERLAARSQR